MAQKLSRLLRRLRLPERLRYLSSSGHGTHATHHDEATRLPRFYDLLQESPASLKHGIRTTRIPSHRRVLVAALIVRAVLIMAFAIAFILAFKACFGEQASAPAVSLFVMLLCLRCVGFNYRFGQDLLALVIVCVVLALAPLLAQTATPVARFFINLCALVVLFVVGVDDPRYGNGGTYGFIYAYLTGMAVAHPLGHGEAIARLATMACGCGVCALVHWLCRTRVLLTDRRIVDALREFSLASSKTRYQLRAATGISVAVLLAELLGFERVMWVGIVASSLLTPWGFKVSDRMGWRVGFTLVGVAVFALVYPRLSPLLAAVFPLLGGLGNGLSATYQWQQVFNTLGALLVGSAALGGVQVAGFWRMADTVFAVAVCLVVSGLWMRASRRLQTTA